MGVYRIWVFDLSWNVKFEEDYNFSHFYTWTLIYIAIRAKKPLSVHLTYGLGPYCVL